MKDGNRRREATSTGERTVISNIMQRFRPIAPKPVAGGCLNKSHDEGFGDVKCSIGRNRRSKRKYVRVRNNNNSENSDSNISNSNGDGYKRKKTTRAPTADLDKDTGSDKSGFHTDIETLQLLPEKEKDLPTREHVFSFRNSVSTGDRTENRCPGPLPGEDRMIMSLSPVDRTVVESWVTVECVTGTCSDESLRNHLGGTDAERVRYLEVDTCPGFVSDGSNRVKWVNGSYRRMMGVSGGEDVRVWVVVTVDQIEEMVCTGELYGAVTCRVRVQYESTWRKENMTVPCDVWKMGSGGFAWRLDVEAALSLGRR